MVLVSLAKVAAPVNVPRKELPKYAVQLVFKTSRMDWVTKPFYVRNPPFTIWAPTARQAAWRLAFGLAAEKWRGAKGRAALKYDSRSGKHAAGDIVLAVQARAQEVLKAVYQGLQASMPPKKEKKYGMSEATKKKLEAHVPSGTVSAIEAAVRGVA